MTLFNIKVKNDLERQVTLESRPRAEKNGYHTRNSNRKLNVELVAHISVRLIHIIVINAYINARNIYIYS